MYNELCEAWKRELANRELEVLPSDFYPKIAEYLKNIKEESRMLDRRTVKAGLLKRENQNVSRMIRELVRVRYMKLIRKSALGEVKPDTLTAEEESILKAASPAAEIYQSFVKNIVRGQLPKTYAKPKNTMVALRFLKEVPAIIGADMKTYGPFKIEDVASLPSENARNLTKQGMTETIET